MPLTRLFIVLLIFSVSVSTDQILQTEEISPDLLKVASDVLKLHDVSDENEATDEAPLLVDEIQLTEDSNEETRQKRSLRDMFGHEIPSLNVPKSRFMHGYMPFGVGNREILKVVKVSELSVKVNPISIPQTWRYSRFNSTDYLLLHQMHHIHIWKHEVAADRYSLDFDTTNAVCKVNEEGEIIHSIFYTRFDDYVETLEFTYVLRSRQGEYTLRSREVFANDCSFPKIVKLEQSKAPLKLHIVESHHRQALFLLYEGTTDIPQIHCIKCGHQSTTKLVEINVQRAKDLDAFFINGNAIVAVGHGKGCDIYEFDDSFEQPIWLQSMAIHALTDIQTFRLGFDYFLGFATKTNAQHLFIWEDGLFLESQIFDIPPTTYWQALHLTTCREDVILIFHPVDVNAPRSVFTWNGVSRKFELAVTDLRKHVARPYVPRLFSQITFAYNSVAYLLEFDTRGFAHLIALQTNLISIGDPLFAISNRITILLKSIRDRFEFQQSFIDKIRNVLRFAVTKSGNNQVNTTQVFHSVKSLQSATVQRVTNLKEAFWDKSPLTLDDLKHKIEDLRQEMHKLIDAKNVIKEKLNDVAFRNTPTTITGRVTFLGHVENKQLNAKSLHVENVAGNSISSLLHNVYRLGVTKGPVRGRKQMLNVVGVRGSLETDFVNEMRLKLDAVVANRPTLINSTLHFNSLNIEKSLFINGHINGIRLERDLIFLRGANYLTRSPWIFSHPVTIVQNLESRLINGIDFENLPNHLLTVNKFQHVKSPILFSGSVFIRNVRLNGSINGFHLPALLSDLVRIDRSSIITGQKYIANDMIVRNNMEIRGKLDGLRIPHDLVTVNTRQKIFAKKYFRGDVTFKNPVSAYGLVDGLRFPHDIVMKNEKRPIKSMVVFANGISALKDVKVKGLVDGVDLSQIEASALKKQSDRFRGTIVFKGNVVLTGNLNVTGFVNHIKLRNVYNDVVFKNSRRPIRLTAPKIFKGGEIFIPKLHLNTLNNYPLRSFVPTNHEVKILPRIIFTAPVTIHNMIIKDGIIAGINMLRLLQHRISLTHPGYIVDGMHFNLLRASSLIVRGTVNGVRLRDELVLKSKPQTIKALKIFNRKVNFDAGLVVNGRIVTHRFVNGLNLTDLALKRITLSGNQMFPFGINVAESSFNKVNLKRGDTFNGFDLLQFVRNVVRRNGNQVILAPKSFKHLLIDGNATTTNGINNISLRYLQDNAVKLHGDQVILGTEFSHSLSVSQNIIVNGLVNGFNLRLFAINAIRKTGPTIIKGVNTFLRGFEVRGDIHTASVNGINFATAVLSKSRDQIVSGSIKFRDLEINGNVFLRGKLNKIKLAQFNHRIMRTDRPNLIFGNLKFKKPVKILNNLRTDGQLNGLHMNELEQKIVHRNGQQRIAGTVILKAKSSFLSNLNAESINDVNLKQFLNEIILVRNNNHQVIQSHKLFRAPVRVKGDVRQENGNTFVRGFVNGVNLNALSDSSVRTDRPIVIHGALSFQDNVFINSPEGVEINGRINGIDIKRDVVLLHKNPVGTSVQPIRGRFVFEKATVRNNIVVDGLVNGFDIRKLASDTLLKFGDQNISGKKINIGGFSVFERGAFVRRLNDINDLRDIATVNENRFIPGHWTFADHLILNRNLHVTGSLGAADLKKLFQESLLKNVPQVISHPIAFETVVFKRDVHIGGPINGFQISDFSNNYRTFYFQLNASNQMMDSEMIQNLNVANNLLALLEHSIHRIDSFRLFQELIGVRGTRFEIHGKELFGITELNREHTLSTVHLIRYNEYMNIFERRGVEKGVVHAMRKMFYFVDDEYIIHQSSPNNGSQTFLRKGRKVIATLGTFIDDIQFLNCEERKEVMITALTGVIGEVQVFLLKKVGQEVVFAKLSTLIVGPTANKVTLFYIEGDYFIAVARGSHNLCPNSDTGSVLFQWENRQAFRLIQRFPLISAIDVTYYLFNGHHYLAFADVSPIDETLQRQGIYVYRFKPHEIKCPFTLFQKLPFDNTKDVTAFLFGSEARPEMFIAAVNSSTLQLWRQDGQSGFPETWAMQIVDGRFVEPILVDKRLFLVIGQMKACAGSFIYEAVIKAVVCDLNDEKQIKILFDKTIATFGGLNVLVNNAGWYTEVNVLDENVLQLANKHYAVNIRAIIQLCHHFMPFLIKSKGAVVNVSSIPIPFYPHYYFNVTTSRAAADMLAKNMAAQFAANGVRVNTVNVGGVDTPSFNEMKSAEEKRKVLCEFTPLRRLGKSEEIAKAILFLASDMAEYITGVNLPVDGGALLL
ncbi:hypothetical protein B4U79_09365 [Dinothrombium tinctorium]|uniref:Uncharacterized protein n=1 Tax=Dinothrombium tinctorium TaxID=1965070 RepID=A0A3S3Q0A3_9ACAR|nr:hypothetical protein B4U79_13445 [Dinothrombium tinctorium]RWS13389.1 hypothetical protein B4U79_09365 [Dinothrombium tinctorium]